MKRMHELSKSDRCLNFPHPPLHLLQNPLPPPAHLNPPKRDEAYEIEKEVILALTAVSPFHVRCKDDATAVGRAFAFDIVKSGGECNELKMYVEYPIGSGQVFNNAASLVKQMSDTSKSDKLSVSSALRMLEYETKHSPNEWKTLSELLNDKVRFFKERVR